MTNAVIWRHFLLSKYLGKLDRTLAVDSERVLMGKVKDQLDNQNVRFILVKLWQSLLKTGPLDNAIQDFLLA